MCNKKYSKLTAQFKLEVEKSIPLRGCNRDIVWYMCEAVNSWFNMQYPSIHEKGQTKKEYLRLYWQYLWRWIADHDDQDYTEALNHLEDIFCKK